MTDHPLVAIEPATEIGYKFQFRATAQAEGAAEIGGLWFVEDTPAFHQVCRGIFEEGTEPQKVRDILELMERVLAIGASASQSSSHSFSQESFLPFDADALLKLGLLLSQGKAHLRRSRLHISHEDEDFVWAPMRKLGLKGLKKKERDTLEFLNWRRGTVGRPLEAFWQVACHLGIARDAQETQRRYGSGSIPKLKIDDHLFQIERQPLWEQVKQAMSEDCRGLVWIQEDRRDRTGFVLDLQALTFDEPDAVRAHLEKADQEMLQQIHDVMSKRQSALGAGTDDGNPEES